MSQSPKQLLNCLNGSETSVALIIFNGVLCHIRVYSVKFTVGSTRIRNKKNYIYWSVVLVPRSLVFDVM